LNPKHEIRNPKRFDRLTALSKVEGQYRMIQIRMIQIRMIKTRLWTRVSTWVQVKYLKHPRTPCAGVFLLP
ncbi:MAG: hypothetical protein DRH90_23340, partial [Deltaproteobacteria bacterium]